MADEKLTATEEKVEKAPAKKAAAKKPAAKAADKAAPKAAKKTAAKAEAGTVKITLMRALTGCSAKQIAIAHSLGLKRVGEVVIQPDNAPTMGKVAKIAFLLDVVKP